MPKKKKVKILKNKKTSKIKVKAKMKLVVKTSDKKTSVLSSDEKPEIRKIK